MKLRLYNVRYDKQGRPMIVLRGKWLRQQGFGRNNRIAVLYNEQGKLTILNADTVIHQALEEEYQQQINHIK